MEIHASACWNLAHILRVNNLNAAANASFYRRTDEWSLKNPDKVHEFLVKKDYDLFAGNESYLQSASEALE